MFVHEYHGWTISLINDSVLLGTIYDAHAQTQP